MFELDPEPRMLAFRLLGVDLNHKPCMTYACGCVCEGCLERAERAGRRRVALPWELDAEAA